MANMRTIMTRMSPARRAKLLAALVAALALASCHRSSGGGSGGSQPPPSSRTYSATVTGVEITRPADGLSMAVSGLPAQGAVLTVP